jgi:hypothetical protein
MFVFVRRGGLSMDFASCCGCCCLWAFNRGVLNSKMPSASSELLVRSARASALAIASRVQKLGGGTGWVHPKMGSTPGWTMCLGLQRKDGVRVSSWQQQQGAKWHGFPWLSSPKFRSRVQGGVLPFLEKGLPLVLQSQSRVQSHRGGVSLRKKRHKNSKM